MGAAAIVCIAGGSARVAITAEFSREIFERLLGFWGTSRQIVEAQRLLDLTRERGELRIANPHGERAFKRGLRDDDLAQMRIATQALWGDQIIVIDTMAGGGSIPLESARLGLHTLANEYNPVACSVLEATVDYPFRFGTKLADGARKWAAILRERFNARIELFFPRKGALPTHCYLFARTVACPDTLHHTPLVPDWHLLIEGSSYRLVAEPVVDKADGTWSVRIREVGSGGGKLREAPKASYSDGKGISLFSGLQIPADYIKAKAQTASYFPRFMLSW